MSSKAPGNITVGKTVERHLADGTLHPRSVVRFYGTGTPERVLGRDVYVSGWRVNRHGGYTFDLVVPVGATFAGDSLALGPGAKVGVYVDQDDARADYGY